MIGSALKVLIAPLAYLRARSLAKGYWDYGLPLFAAAIGSWAYVLAPAEIPVIGEKGLVASVNELLQVLVGFYIAALAAVASLNSVSLDQPVEGDPVTIDQVSVEGVAQVSLNRRRLLSLMFSYLSFSSISLYALGVFVNIANENVKQILPLWLVPSAKVGFLGFYVFVVAQLVCITLVTLYYLGDRIHRATPVALPTKPMDQD